VKPVIIDKNVISFERTISEQTVEIYANFSEKDVIISEKHLIYHYPKNEDINKSINRIKAMSFAICIKK